MALRKLSQSLVGGIVRTKLTTTAATVIRCSAVGSRWIYSHPVKRVESAQAENIMDIGTRKIFDADHDLFRQTARRFFQDEVLPYHPQWEKDGQVSREVWLKAGECGLLGPDCPEKFGGSGGDWLDAVIVTEEQSYINCTGPGFTVHSSIVMPYIYKYGTKEQIEKYIPRMLNGSCIGAIAMTEPSAGSDLQGIKTHARRDGSDWILNGSKVFISNGYMCDMAIVVAVTDPNTKSKAHGISLFLVDADTPGFKKGRKLEKIGLKAQDTAELFFEDVRLPESSLLGPLNGGFYGLMTELVQERLIIGTTAIAVSEFIFEETRSYVKQRKAFGKTLANLQTIQHKLAELKTEICISRVFMDHVNMIHNTSKCDNVSASMAKYWMTEVENRVASQCLQLHGGWGYMWEFPVARAFADARVSTIYGGSSEIMKELIARHIIADK